MTIALLFSQTFVHQLYSFLHAHILSRDIARRLMLSLVMATVLGLANAHAQSQNQGQLSIDALGQSYAAAKPVAAGLSRLTIYRSASDGGADAVSVYIDGAYHTSLVKRGYSEVCLKPGTTDIGVRRVEVSADIRNRMNVSRLTLQNTQQQYLRVSDQAGMQPVVQVVSPAQAESELAQTRQQIHTLSRAITVVPCETASAVVTPVAPQVISLASDALFPFGKSALNDMLLEGRTALDAVVNRVKTEYTSVDSIKVIGHSDPIGRPVDKQIISSQRAQTVRDYISRNGLQSTRILSEGRADNELALNGCGNRPTPSSIECNAPNRRVAIEISGTRR